VAKKIKYVGSKAVNKDSLPSLSVFNDSFQTTIFNGGINLSTVFTNNTTISREKRIIVTRKDISLSDLKIKDIDELNNFIKISNKLKLNLDITNLSNYAVYGSLKEKFRFAVNNIINKFPGGLFLDTYVSGISYFNILNYTYDIEKGISTFKVPVTVIDNPFYINTYENISLTSNSINSLTTRYLDYTLFYNDINYGINGFTGFSTTNSSFLYLSINGDPFSGNSSPQNISEKVIIKPNDIEFNKFYDSLNDLERYFLNKNSTPKYTFKFKIPEVNEDDELVFIDYIFTIPLNSDGYNLDTESINYVDFLETLFGVGDLYDEYKSNLIIRKFIPKTLIDFDSTDSFKSESILKVYGKEIDEIKLFIDSLMSINTVTYDKINNIPDTLIKNLARTLGWKAQNIINNKDLLGSVFANDKSGDTDIIASLAEVDIELWRRLTINTAWFLKSKGTRKALETIFSFIGAPDYLIAIDEHIYVVEVPLDSSLVNQTLLNDTTGLVLKPAYDADGFPANPTFTATDYFQANGNEDRGQYFINLYRNLGFGVTRIVDNKKSWVYYESASTHSSIDRDVYYDLNDSRLLINTKEVSLGIDAARAIEYDVYTFNKQYNYPVSSTGRTFPYPQRDSNKIQVSGLTFGQYVQNIYSKFINAQNRKVIQSETNVHYPSLAKLYNDYLDNSLADIGVVSNKRRYANLLDYIDNLDGIFDVFVKQFIPATTIIEGGGINIRNTVFTPQKFVYKHGIDDGSEFETGVLTPAESTQSLVTIESEFFETVEKTITLATISTTVNISNNGNVDTEPFASVIQNVNLEPKWDSLSCELERPNFALTGATKIELSSLTNNSLFNKSTETGKTLTFNFTSSTSTLSASTTEFYYTVHKYNKDISGFDDAPIYTFSASSTAFTATTLLSDTISGSLLTCDSEYIVKPYFNVLSCGQTGITFVSASTPYTMYDEFPISGYTTDTYIDINGNTKFYRDSERFINFKNPIINTGSSFTTLLNNTTYATNFRNYNKTDDFYFVSYCKPDNPNLNLGQITETQGLIVEPIPIVVTSFTGFSLTYEPVGDIVVAVNGVTIQKGLEYVSDTSILLPAIAARSFRLLQRLTSLHDDILTITYYRNTANNQKLLTENLTYPSSSQITYNGLDYQIVSSNNIINNNDVLVYYNGVQLQNSSDYYVSVFSSNTIILKFTPPNESLFKVVYFTNSDPISNATVEASGPTYQINWSISNPIENGITGNFVHQFYPLSNTGLTGTTLYSALTPYDYITTQYSTIFDWNTITPSPLVKGSTYYYRIASEKQFTTINYINLSTTAYSTTIKLKLPQ
jgi:hypothetical protein